MCAICGIINFDRQPVAEPVLTGLRDAMANRGPDHGGLYVAGGVGLGHRRLKVIDLSPQGNQPMANEDQSVWVVFNGEAYNFPELKQQLLQQGHRFRSQSDTEVIVHGYEEWGEGVVRKLDGMFALGLWDSRLEKLLLARDRFGKKPLYYWHHGHRLVFASELKAFGVLPEARFTVNVQAVDCYLHHLGTTQAHCIYQEIAKVQPAHYQVFTRAGSAATRYWTPAFPEKLDANEPEILELMDQHLRAAVKKRLLSDVPLGAFLSGGVDSSLVVALMSQLTGRPVRTFSIGFDEQDFCELQFADDVARRYQTDHHQMILKPDVLAILPGLVWEYGEPFADSSAIPTYYVAQGARQFVTVALSGDGGDELFGGYDIARAAWYAQRYDCWCPGWMRRRLEPWLLRDGGVGDRHPWLHKLKTLMVHAHADPAVRHSYSMAFTPGHKARLYTSPFKEALAGHAAWHVFAPWQPDLQGLDLIDQHLFLTIVSRLVNDYLVKVDVAAMKVALELRSPFLDTALYRLSSAIDPQLKVRGGRQKYLLKKLAERYLPREVIYRKKRGFALPLKHWLRGELAPVLRQWLPEGQTIQAGWFDPRYVTQLIQEHSTGTADHTHRLWALLWLELWYRLFITKTLQPQDSLKGITP